MKRGRGQPSKYHQKIATVIVEELSEGKPLRQICREQGIHWRTAHLWMHAHPDFAERIRLARELGQDAIAEECLSLADTPLMGEVHTVKPTGVEVKTEDMLGHRRLQIDTRLKLLAKWNPKRYGDRITHAGDVDAPVTLILKGSDIHG